MSKPHNIREQRKDRAASRVVTIGEKETGACVLDGEVPHPELPTFMPGVPRGSGRQPLGVRSLVIRH